MYSRVRNAALRAPILVMVLTVALPGTAVAQTADGDLTRQFGGESLRDPTRPAGATMPGLAAGEEGGDLLDAGTGSGRRFRVSFIRAGGSRPMAVINNQPVRVGELIGDVRVLGIEAGAVALEVDGERRMFTTWQAGAVRQPVAGGAVDSDTMDKEAETDN